MEVVGVGELVFATPTLLLRARMEGVVLLLPCSGELGAELRLPLDDASIWWSMAMQVEVEGLPVGARPDGGAKKRIRKLGNREKEESKG